MANATIEITGRGRYFLYAPVAPLVITYVWWFWLTPPTSWSSDPATAQLVLGLVLLGGYVATVLALTMSKAVLGARRILLVLVFMLAAFFLLSIAFGAITSPGFLFPVLLLAFVGEVALYIFQENLKGQYRIIRGITLLMLSLTAIILLFLSVICPLVMLPLVQDVRVHKENVYYLTDIADPFDAGTGYYYLAIWRWPPKYESYDLGRDYRPNIILLYDQKLDKVGAEQLDFDGQQRLIFADGSPPRFYDYYSYLHRGQHNYYISYDCAEQVSWADCNLYSYTLFQCDADNTSCEMLPFHYVGKYAHDTQLTFNQATQQIDLTLHFSDSPNIPPILIYSHGQNPRCYVDGCSLTPK